MKILRNKAALGGMEVEDLAPLRHDNADFQDTDDYDSQDQDAQSSSSPHQSITTLTGPCTSYHSCRLCFIRVVLVGLFTLFGFVCLILLTRGSVHSNYRLEHFYNQPAALSVSTNTTTPSRFSVVVVGGSVAHQSAVLSSLLALQSCQFFDSAFVVWSSGGSSNNNQGVVSAVPSAIRKFGTVMSFNTSSAMHALTAPASMVTDAVFVTDARSSVVCSDIDFAFLVWLGSPDRLVGFAPRLVQHDTTTATTTTTAATTTTTNQGHTSSSSSSSSSDSAQAVWLTSSLNMVQADGMFVHRKHLHSFQLSDDAETRGVRKVVDEDGACLDLAFNFHVARMTQQAPLWVFPRWWHGQEVADNDVRRVECIDKLVAQVGSFPLHTSYGMFRHVLSTLFSF